MKNAMTASTFQRVSDVLIALLLLALTWPLFIILIILIRGETPGPALFIQTRTGRNGRPFRIYKFRTMVYGTPDLPTHEAPKACVTRLGYWLRKTKLDELPQIVNVLLGSMTFVGPRPCLLTQTQLIEARRQRGILDVRPGITGLAQALGIDMSDLNRLVETETHYIKTRSLLGDLRILVATFLGPWILRRSMAI